MHNVFIRGQFSEASESLDEKLTVKNTVVYNKSIKPHQQFIDFMTGQPFLLGVA